MRRRVPVGRVAAAVLGVAVLVLAVIVMPWPKGALRPSDPGSAPSGSADSEVGEQTASGRDQISLTVPDTVRAAEGSATLQPGEVYLAQANIVVDKPEGSSGAAMYLNYSLQCTGAEQIGERASGTQNLLTGMATDLAARTLLRVEEPGRVECNVSLSAPNEEVAAAGSTVEADIEWELIPVGSESFAVSAVATQLPTLVSPAAEESFEVRESGIDLGANRPHVSASIRVTTCTGEAGSKEGGTTWCTAQEIDETGSTVRARLSVRYYDTEGELCGTGVQSLDHVRIDRFVHHATLHLDVESPPIARECSGDVAVSLTVSTSGPAAVVVHQRGTSLLIYDPVVAGAGS